MSRSNQMFSIARGSPTSPSETTPNEANGDTAPPSQRRGPWQICGVRELYKDEFVCLRIHDVLQPDEQPGTYAVVESPDGFGVVALNDAGEVYLVGQHRFAVDEFSWEIPTGGADEGEEPLVGAQRELKEETGIEAARWTPLGRIHPAGSLWASSTHIFLAQDLTEGETEPDSTERLSRRKVPLEEALRMAATGEITHAASAVALFRAWYCLQGSTEVFEKNPDRPG